jgi:hypothetical protein
MAYTRHGHRIRGSKNDGPFEGEVLECGGPGRCVACHQDVREWHRNIPTAEHLSLQDVVPAPLTTDEFMEKIEHADSWFILTYPKTMSSHTMDLYTVTDGIVEHFVPPNLITMSASEYADFFGKLQLLSERPEIAETHLKILS